MESSLFIPHPLAGYDDWTECLGVMLQQFLEAEPSLDFEDWAFVHGALLGVGFAHSRRRHFTRQPGTLPILNLCRATVASIDSVLASGDLWNAAFDDLWTAIAAHRAGADWVAHLAAAATLGGVVPRSVARGFCALYKLVFAGTLEQIWARHPEDPGLEVDAAEHRRHATALGATVGGHPALTPALTPPEERRVVPFLASPTSFSLSGRHLVDDELIDASLQVMLTDGWPGIVMDATGFPFRSILVPTGVSEDRIEFRDVTYDSAFVARRLGNTTTGWVISNN